MENILCLRDDGCTLRGRWDFISRFFCSYSLVVIYLIMINIILWFKYLYHFLLFKIEIFYFWIDVSYYSISLLKLQTVVLHVNFLTIYTALLTCGIFSIPLCTRSYKIIKILRTLGQPSHFQHEIAKKSIYHNTNSFINTQ